MDEFNLATPKPKPKRHRPIIGLAVLILIVLVAASGFYYSKKTPPPPPQLMSLASDLTFPVYYPSELPAGYSYTDGSAKFQGGLFYYKLHNGTKVISITQQPIPSSSVNLQKLPSYSSLDVPAGPAAIGVSIGNPSAVIATGSTLVSINSSKGVSKDTVVAVAKKIKQVEIQGSASG